MPREKKSEESLNPMSFFIKEVGSYFMDFLETDFHKRKLPKRSIKLHNEKGLLTGINLSKYPSFCKVGHDLVNECFREDILNIIQKNIYKADIPKALLDLIKRQIEKVSDSDIDTIIKKIDDLIKKEVLKNKDDYLESFNSIMSEIDNIFKKYIILDLVKGIEKSLESSKLADENAIFQIEEELVNILKKKIEETVSEILKQMLIGEKPNVKKLLKESLNIDDIKASLTEFFDMFKVSDLFNDLHELYQNFKMEDKQEFYFYFCDISYQKDKYPIFYIPFSLERKGDAFSVSFDSQIYINKKALAYIAQEYNLERDKKGTLQTIADRIIYLADHGKNLHVILQETITELTNFFGLDEKIQINKPVIHSSKNLYVSISTNLYISLFDKSDEALLNDYEDILNATEESSLMEGFKVLIDDFINKNPESVQTSIADDWDEKSVDEKLVSKSPIPLNSEQQQIISAINNDKCKYVLVEGPPGTGKSHTITAIVFDMILHDKSVLVLSDKKEALDVVEKNIVNTLNKVRVDEKFQNPLLRLGKTGNTYSQLLTQASIDGITEQFRAVRSKYPNLNDQIDDSIVNLRSDVEAQIEAYKEISLTDVDELVSLKNHFKKDNIGINIDEAVKNPNSVVELRRIREILLNVKGKAWSSKSSYFKFDFRNNLDEKNLDNLNVSSALLISLENIFNENQYLADAKLLSSNLSFLRENKSKIERLVDSLIGVNDIVNIINKNEEYLELIGVQKEKMNDLVSIDSVVRHTLLLKSVLEKIKYFAKEDIFLLNNFNESHEKDLINLEEYINSIKKLKNRLFGYLGKSKEVEELNKNFRKNFSLSKFETPSKSIKELETILSIYKYILELRNETPDLYLEVEYLYLVTSILKNDNLYFPEDELHLIAKLFENIAIIRSITSDSMTLKEANDLKVIYEIDNIYNNFCLSILRERDLIEANVDLKNSSSIEKLIQNNNLKSLIKEIDICCNYVAALIEIKDDIKYLKDLSDKHDNSLIITSINSNNLSTLYNNKLTEVSDLEFEKFLHLISINQNLINKFDCIKDLSYGEKTKQIENIVTMQMTYLMDERFVNFTNTYKADAKVLKQIIKDKKKFPKEQFSKLKSAFPCMLAGIRDYAEYIPLEPGIFDLVIIDEASQVSIAQAFPALLRAKKVVVLGDSLQFSNVKSALARGDINKHHLTNLKDVFTKNISTETDKVVRLEKFNIKVSILDFMGFINNYQTRLVKHFRGYRELISYSNKIFYNGSLQVMKVRGVPISSVIKFTQVEHDGLEEIVKNTNNPEIDFIISELKKLKLSGKKCSVGIITPHTNQQKLLYEKINSLPESDYFFDILKLKIMTFDTCQGEEMDIIFYSMVATVADDKLNYVFISDLNSIELDDDEGKIKAQRLNVGLSRSKECMHFVLSKPIDQYKGTVKEFLQHYSNILIENQKEFDSTSVDKNSKMEPLVLDWFYQTKFWKENKEAAEIIPQFELGKYLKQLDKSYNHPNYRVDFLLVYNDNEGMPHKIILEYDGFMEHFGDSAEVVNEINYQEYYSPEDVYRQNVLEGYGYKFIRINKFNLGENPVLTLDLRIQEILKKKLLTTK